MKPNASLGPALAYAEANQERFVKELKAFLRFRSVSSDPKRSKDVRQCATWLADRLKRVGVEKVRVIATPRNPIVFGEWKHRSGRPTLLIYGHYDVQPPGSLGEWRSPPFEPTIRGPNLYARGASDDKGQLFTHIKAIESYMRTSGSLPVNVICLFDGGEEIGSPNLDGFLTRNRNRVRADVAVISDTRMLAPDRPPITYALRGALDVELRVRGAVSDLHAGAFGGAIRNPAHALCELIAGLHESDGKVAIRNFYDSVRRVPAMERTYMARTGPVDDSILEDAGSAVPWGEVGYTLHERTTIRPAVNVTAIECGSGGLGQTSVIPSTASARLNFRLVPDQCPRRIERLLRRHFASCSPASVGVSVRRISDAKPVRVDVRHPVIHAAFEACAEAFGRDPVFVRSGGTIPVVAMLQAAIDAPVVLMGFALPDDGMHAPNEKMYLPNFHRGIDAGICFMSNLAQPGAALSADTGR